MTVSERTLCGPGDSGWLVACDLDQTLIYSRSAFRLADGAPAPELLSVEQLDGEPLSYLTRRAAAGIRELALASTFVPVTTRTLEQYRRVQLGVPSGVRDRGQRRSCDRRRGS